MAPYSTTFSTTDNLRFTEKDKIKLRKPIVEKMRRDRINGCIDQLKKLLEKEFLSQDPNTKLEKADILEMTVNFLRQQQQQQTAFTQRDFNEGYSHCWRESVHFLSIHSKRGASIQDLQHFQHVQTANSGYSSTRPVTSKKGPAAQQDLGSRRLVWRPW
ncbi:hairy-related 12 [Chanos chanos]|uniref:Transcription factor HES-5 n=1 Tax=Chanos chanos TaxID=29144 RepID=A0A6J2UT19_CHACN|nr:transcription factor HES-5-like [Chanos chanos]